MSMKSGGRARALWITGVVAMSPCTVIADEPGYLVSWHFTNSIRSYDRDGNYLGDFAVGEGLSTPQHMDISTDGILYVGTYLTDSVRMYDAETGEYLGILAEGEALNGADVARSREWQRRHSRVLQSEQPRASL